MSVLSPPPHDELELLIREARARQRRRRLIAAAAVAVAAGLGLSLWAAIPGGGVAGQADPRPVTGTANASFGRSTGLRTIADVGSSGGVTWVVNGRGVWLTQNGGRAWRKLKLPLGTGAVYSNGSALQFLDRRDGWMDVNEIADSGRMRRVGGVLARTVDGGRRWKESAPPICRRRCSPFAQISFLTARRGWALTSSGRGRALYRTSDAGGSWHLVSRPSVGGAITFIGRRTGFLAEPQAIIGPEFFVPAPLLFRTTDGGRTWSQSSLPWSPKQAIDERLFAFGQKLVAAVLPPNHVDGWPKAIYTSRDGGGSWTRHLFPQFAFTGPTSFSAVSPTTWFLAAHRTLLVTHDAGATWQRIALRTLPWKTRLSQIDFTSSRDGWAILSPLPGGHGSLLRTTDGGRHWKPAGPRKPARRKHA